jgi:cellulase/cellobiase CelA1
MNMLFVNHGAKGIAMWDYPTEPDLVNITSSLSKTLTSENVSSFLLGSFVSALTVEGVMRVDAASWTIGNRTLVSVVNKNYVDSSPANVSIPLRSAASVGQVVWGTGWTVSGEKLVKTGMQALEVDIFVVQLA